MEIHLSDRTFSLEGCRPLPVSLPELRFRNSDVIGDPINCYSASSIGDIGLEVDDDLFSMYIDLEKLEEREGNVGHDNNFHVNGGGFVVESGDDSGRGRRRSRKKNDRNVKNQTRKTQRCNKEKSCPATGGGVLEPRKAIIAEELAKLWVINPKRAQRIMSNRQSAARSKEKKARYTLDLEKNVKTLHAKTLELSLQLATNQKEITDLATEKSELELQLQTMEHEVKRYDDQNEELQQEIESLRTAIGETDYSDWLNKRMNSIPPHSPSKSHLTLPQLPASPMSQQNLLPLIHSSQLSMST